MTSNLECTRFADDVLLDVDARASSDDFTHITPGDGLQLLRRERVLGHILVAGVFSELAIDPKEGVADPIQRLGHVALVVGSSPQAHALNRLRGSTPGSRAWRLANHGLGLIKDG